MLAEAGDLEAGDLEADLWLVLGELPLKEESSWMGESWDPGSSLGFLAGVAPSASLVAPRDLLTAGTGLGKGSLGTLCAAGALLGVLSLLSGVERSLLLGRILVGNLACPLVELPATMSSWMVLWTSAMTGIWARLVALAWSTSRPGALLGMKETP